MIRETLNARRLLCPLPVIRTQDKVKQLKVATSWRLSAPIRA